MFDQKWRSKTVCFQLLEKTWGTRWVLEKTWLFLLKTVKFSESHYSGSVETVLLQNLNLNQLKKIPRKNTSYKETLWMPKFLSFHSRISTNLAICFFKTIGIDEPAWGHSVTCIRDTQWAKSKHAWYMYLQKLLTNKSLRGALRRILCRCMWVVGGKKWVNTNRFSMANV